MSLWGISTNAETAANNYAIPKHLLDTDRNTTPWNCFADQRGWCYRRYGSSEHSGLSTSFYDEVLVPVVGLNTAGVGNSVTGLGTATPVAVFFEDPNKASPISIGGGGTDRLPNSVSGAGGTGYVHLVYNEPVFCSAGATILINRSVGGAIVGSAISIAPGATITYFMNDQNFIKNTNYNGQITNRVAFAFTASGSGVGTVFTIDMTRGVVGTITDFSNVNATKTFTSDILRNVGGAGTTGSVGIGTTTLTIK
jgi:hypothetical protein